MVRYNDPEHRAGGGLGKKGRTKNYKHQLPELTRGVNLLVFSTTKDKSYDSRASIAFKRRKRINFAKIILI